MRLPSRNLKYLLIGGIASAALATIAWSWQHAHHKDSIVPSHVFKLEANRKSEWTVIGGKWQIADGVVKSESTERGSKILAGSSHWSNYTLTSDVGFTGVAADMGLIIRSNDESEGVDSYNGYYVGLRSLDGSLVIGRSNYGWVEARPVFMPGGVHPYVWYRLRVTAYGCQIAASAQNLTTLQTAWIAFEDSSCVRTGRVGLRSLNDNGLWRNISVTSAGRNDYLGLRQYAASVEWPVILDGPPWWTPWHVGMLFAGALSLALVTQFIFFRVHQWKAYMVIQERERLAHDIHDTMAQGFAGIGYQIQGIRHLVVRDNHPDSGHIADQLSAAYQLVRKCHEEASKTISMLGSSSPLVQQNLLGALAETAQKIAGDHIKTIKKVHGKAAPLNLRLADALLHIGQEAIANAVSHSDPTVLTITLRYEGNSVELEVEDNGKGFEYTPDTAGFGIIGMQKRAIAVDGTLHIVSSPGHGTRIQVKVKL